MAEAAASNDVGGVGRLLGAREAKSIEFRLEVLPESVQRKPLKSSLLDVAVGAGAVEVAKCLLEFHGVEASRETLKEALSTGSPELIRVIWQRLPEGEFRFREDLLEVSADFHREVALGWLLREASVFERELFAVFALERHLADGLLVVYRNGLRPWSYRTREAAKKWGVSASAGLEFVSAPEGFESGRRLMDRCDGSSQLVLTMFRVRSPVRQHSQESPDCWEENLRRQRFDVEKLKSAILLRTAAEGERS
jgi:hypothetical protein